MGAHPQSASMSSKLTIGENRDEVEQHSRPEADNAGSPCSLQIAQRAAASAGSEARTPIPRHEVLLPGSFVATTNWRPASPIAAIRPERRNPKAATLPTMARTKGGRGRSRRDSMQNI